MKLTQHRLNGNQETGNLDAAAGTAGTGTYKHQHDQNGFAGFRPLVEIRGGKAGGGDNRSHLKGRLCQGTEQATGKMPDIEGDKPHRSQNNQQIGTYLLHAKCFAELAEQQVIIKIEIDAEQDHKDRDNPLQCVGITGNAVSADTKTTGTGGTNTGGHRIEQRHAIEIQQKQLQQGQTKINAIQNTGCGTDFRYQLAHRGTRAFRTHQVDVGAAAHGDNCQQEYQHAHTANPVGKAAPEQRTMGQGFHILQNAGTGGGKTGNGLK